MNKSYLAKCNAYDALGSMLTTAAAGDLLYPCMFGMLVIAQSKKTRKQNQVQIVSRKHSSKNLTFSGIAYEISPDLDITP